MSNETKHKSAEETPMMKSIKAKYLREYFKNERSMDWLLNQCMSEYASQPCSKCIDIEKYESDLKKKNKELDELIIRYRDKVTKPCSKCEEKDTNLQGALDLALARLRVIEEQINHIEQLQSQLSEANKKCEEKDKKMKATKDYYDVCVTEVVLLQSQLSEANKKCEEKDMEVEIYRKSSDSYQKEYESLCTRVLQLQSQLSEANKEIERLKNLTK